MLSIGSPLFPLLPKYTNIFPFSSNNTTTGEPCVMRLWRKYIFEVCQSKLYQPTTAGSNPLQGDTYPVDLIAWRLSVWNGNIANYPQWKCLHSETSDYTPLIKNFPNSLLEAMSTSGRCCENSSVLCKRTCADQKFTMIACKQSVWHIITRWLTMRKAFSSKKIEERQY